MRNLGILIADDHEFIRRGVRTVLRLERTWKVLGEAANGQEAVEKTKKLKPDIVLLDISMPKVDGFEAIRQIRETGLNTEIVVLTMHESDEMVRAVIQAGARGYVLKSDVGSRLISAVKAVSRHNQYLTKKVSEIVVDSFLRRDSPADPPGSTRVSFTPRQEKVFRLLAHGKLNKEIAEELGIATRTVETHRANVMRKLNVHSMGALVRFAVRNKLIDN